MVLINLSSNAFEMESFEYDNTLTLQDVKHDLLDDLEFRDENDEIIQDELKVISYIKTKEDKVLLDDILTTVLSEFVSEINIYLDVDYIDDECPGASASANSDSDGCSDMRHMSSEAASAVGNSGGFGGGLVGFLGNAVGNFAISDISHIAGAVSIDDSPAIKGFHSGFNRKKKNKPSSFHTRFKPRVGTKVKN